MRRLCPKRAGLGVLSAIALAALSASPARAAVDAELQFVLNSFAFLFWGALVMWMCAGFMMLDAGSVNTRNASVICLKNIGLYAIAGLTFYLIGYNIMYSGVPDGGWFGSFDLLYRTADAEMALLRGDDSATAAVLQNGHAAMSGWLFQMVFLASTGSIVSGTLAERVKLWPFFIFILVLTTAIYPVVGAWTWGGGWLSELGFKDFAGSSVVHSTGGWAALAGALVVGARRDKYRPDGTIRLTPPNNVPAVTLGVLIIWLGFLAFNGGSRLAMGGAADAVAVSNVLANTNLAAAAGLLVALALSRLVFRRVDLLVSLNGAISGLVAIAAGPDIAGHYWAILIGAAGATVCTFGIRLLQRLRIDDEVGAISAHLGAGMVGTLAVCIAGGGDPLVQLAGVAAIGVFVFGVSLAAWRLIDLALGARVSPHVEKLGQDEAELGIVSFPEFLRAEDEEDS